VSVELVLGLIACERGLQTIADTTERRMNETGVTGRVSMSVGDDVRAVHRVETTATAAGLRLHQHQDLLLRAETATGPQTVESAANGHLLVSNVHAVQQVLVKARASVLTRLPLLHQVRHQYASQFELADTLTVNGKQPRARAADLMDSDQPPQDASGSRPNGASDAIEEGEDVVDEDAQMMAMMGFAGFNTTKGQEVEGNQEGGVEIKKRRTWRQYMNRRGGFNRCVHS